jgi:hypothetical protein
MSAMNFTAEETWRGGHYEIEMELGVPSDERLRAALERIWAHPSLKGCVFSRDQEPQAQVRVNPGRQAIAEHLYGVATLPNGATAACGTYVCRLHGDANEAPRDLLSFYVPLGALAGIYGAEVIEEEQKTQDPPFQTKGGAPSAAWRSELDLWLVEIGRFVFEALPFELALVGWEVDLPRISVEGVRRNWRTTGTLRWLLVA